MTVRNAEVGHFDGQNLTINRSVSSVSGSATSSAQGDVEVVPGADGSSLVFSGSLSSATATDSTATVAKADALADFTSSFFVDGQSAAYTISGNGSVLGVSGSYAIRISSGASVVYDRFVTVGEENFSDTGTLPTGGYALEVSTGGTTQLQNSCQTSLDNFVVDLSSTPPTPHTHSDTDAHSYA